MLKLGEKATIRSTAIDVEGEGVISYISALIGVQTRSATARVVLDNEEGHWLPGMFVTAELVTEETQVPVAVSVDAIQTLHDWSVVFGRYGNYLEARPLKLGRSDGKWLKCSRDFPQENSTQRVTALPSRLSWANPARVMTIRPDNPGDSNRDNPKKLTGQTS